MMLIGAILRFLCCPWQIMLRVELSEELGRGLSEAWTLFSAEIVKRLDSNNKSRAWRLESGARAIS